MFTLTNPSAITFPRFNADNTVSALTAANFRSAIGAGTVTTVNAATTSGNPISIDNNTTTPTIELLSATSARNGYLTSTDWTTFNNKQAALGFTPANSTITIATTAPLQGGGNLTANRTLSITQATTSANGFLTSTDWNTFNSKQNTLVSGTTIKTVNGTTLLGSGNLSVGTLVATDTVSLSNRINLKFNIADTSQLNLTSRFAAKQNNITLTTTGTSGAATFIGSTLNIPNYTASGGTGTVTSVGLTAPSIFNVAGSPITTNGTLALTYSGTALPLLNGGTGATTADGALTNLGATAQGKLLFGLQNTVSDKFIKVNSDNTITLLDAADTRTAIGAGVGTVTNVSGTGAISVATGTTTPVISVATAAFGTAGIVTATGTQQFSGDKVFEGITQFNARAVFKDYTYQATRLAGLSSTDRFAAVTLGTGLTLSSGTLSATGGSGTVTSVSAGSPANGLSVATGTTTPVISMALAGASTIGAVSATTQTFGGAKTFTNLVGFQKAIQRPVESVTVSSASITTSSTWIVVNYAGIVELTFPSAASSTGTEFHVKTITNNLVISKSSNVVPLAGGFATTAILPATAGKWATLVSDGTNWVIMQAN
jgi:hypothetical protein